MSLFTNRKRQEAETQAVDAPEGDSGEAASILDSFMVPGAEVPPAPKRRLDDRPRQQAGNVEINATGLLAMLGIDEDASLSEISEARHRFLIEHQADDADDADAAELKERIRQEVNTAYASFRLTHSS